jgi:hypothetical protein
MTFVIRFRPLPEVDEIKALRALLKTALRRFGLRAMSVSEERETEEDKMPNINELYPPSGGTYLKADDLLSNDLTVTIAGVNIDTDIGRDKRGNVLVFRNYDALLVLNATVAKQIAAQHGNNTDDWTAKEITLFRDTSVTYNNQPAPGIRVRPAGYKGGGNGAKPAHPPIGDTIPF